MKTSISACGIFLCAAYLCPLAACERHTDDVATTRNEAQGVAPDNAKKNERDRDNNAVTPLDQGNNEADLRITQEIRRKLMDQSNFSVNAQNVKIITQNGDVTLRGPVETAEEKATIERIARQLVGTNKLVNELEVKAEDNDGKK